MPSQREIARHLGLTQSTVSLALRRGSGVSPATRRLVEKAAEELGYRPSPMVTTLMSHIRNGRKVSDQGCLAILVDAVDQREWLADSKGPYVQHHRGYCEQACMRGYRTECFYLRAPGMSARRIDDILQARGILGLVLAAPKSKQTPIPELSWERYACATTSYSWSHPALDRVATDFRQCVETAFETLRQRGVRRIGMCLDPETQRSLSSHWRAGYLLYQEMLPPPERIPLFLGKPGLSPLDTFKDWLHQYRPEVLISLDGRERVWLEQMKMRVPEDIGLACLNRPTGSHYAGIDENNEAVGRLVCDLVINRITSNTLGLPERPQTILINGCWVDGSSVAHSA